MRSTSPAALDGRAATVLLLLSVSSLLLAGCAGSGDQAAGQPATPTVTVTASTVTASTVTANTGTASTGTASESGTGTASESGTAPATSDAPATSAAPPALPLQDRAFDAGLIVGADVVPGGAVLALDRLTVAGVSEQQLADTGAGLAIDDGSRFGNQATRTYEVGAPDTATYVVTTCTRDETGPRLASSRVALTEFLAIPDLAATPVIVSYDAGLVARLETNPRC